MVAGMFQRPSVRWAEEIINAIEERWPQPPLRIIPRRTAILPSRSRDQASASVMRIPSVHGARSVDLTGGGNPESNGWGDSYRGRENPVASAWNVERSSWDCAERPR